MYLLSLIFVLLFENINQFPLPYNQYEYMIAREKIKQHDQSIQILNNLNSKEKIVNLYFELLRTKDFLNTKNYFYPSRPIETFIENITNNKFYQFLTLLPKGGNLHLHELQVLDRKILLESIKNSSEYNMLYICDQNNCKKKFYLNYFQGNIPLGWTKVKDSNWTINDIIKKTTLIGILNDLKIPIFPTDTEARWNLTDQLGIFGFYEDIINYNVTKYNYMKLILDSALKDNVQLLEFRRSSFGKKLFYFHENGSRIIINEIDEINNLLKFKQDYIKMNPKFIDFTFIVHSRKKSSKEKIKFEINNLIKLHKLYPDLIRGYDMVGEEDQGHTILFHNENLIDLFNYSQQTNNSFNLFFHAGETNWPEEYLPSNYGDGVATFENIYDALVLRTRRIGHGLSLAKRPDIYEYIRQNQIAIEICPASNQILGFVADLRNHPGIVYHRSGIPIVLCGDDPGGFGYNQLTIEFYLATMAWGLNLADLKQIAWNSIEYSSIPNHKKIQGFKKWKNEWDLFINNSYKLACNEKFTNDIINISHILPTYGPSNKIINITLYGIGFEIAICKEIICQFNEKQTNGIFIDLNEILCPTPLNNENLSIVSISLLIDKKILIQSKINYKFIPLISTIINDRISITNSSSKTNQFKIINQKLFSFILIFVFYFHFIE